jgi:hypothetical protein
MFATTSNIYYDCQSIFAKGCQPHFYHVQLLLLELGLLSKQTKTHAKALCPVNYFHTSNCHAAELWF